MAGRGRPRKQELVTKTEFARRCGLHLAQISMYTGGSDPRLVIDESGKMDVRNPTNALFIETQKKKKDRQNALDTADAETRIELANIMKAEADAKWKAVKARKEMDELVDKRVSEAVILQIGKTLREVLLPQGERVSPKICALFGIVNKSKQLEIQKFVDEENGKVLDEVKKILKQWIEETEFFEAMDDELFS